MNDLGAAIAAAMARRGLTDRRVADMLGVKSATISRWRNGRNIPSPSQALMLAGFTGVPLDEIEEMIRSAQPAQPADTDAETLRTLILALEAERDVTYVSTGIDKSRYYRLRSGGGVPHLADIPDLAKRLGVPEERVVMAVYRTALAGRDMPAEQPAKRARVRRKGIKGGKLAG